MQCVNWLFGRGLSCACNLDWTVPEDWKALPREAQIARIKAALRDEMERPEVDCGVIRKLFGVLSSHTAPGWQHLFITTNWDLLLEREIDRILRSGRADWLAHEHVFHLNGTVAEGADPAYASPFLLEDDAADERIPAPEAHQAFRNMVRNQVFVVIGMSFRAEIDRFLVRALGQVQDNLQLGPSRWIVINDDRDDLQACCDRLQALLPPAAIRGVHASLNDWLERDLPDLQNMGAVRPRPGE